MNEYFQFENLDDGLYINIFAPESMNPNIFMEKVIAYLDKAKIPGCDLTAIKGALTGNGRNTHVKVGENVLPSNEFGEYRVSSDFLRVEAVFYPGFAGASMMSAQEIIRDLNNMGIKHGVDEELINRLVADKKYFESYQVAQGTPAVDGVDGYITYKFETQKKAAPRINDDGSVDFHDLDTLNHVKAGDVVAVMTPEIPGVFGTDVFGRNIIPKKERKAVFKYGKKLSISSDGLNLISDVSGHVSLEGGKIFVSDVLQLVNVDASTGDINYDGSVKVSGNIQAGFSVKASGDIDVNGVVEGARVEAGGNLTIVHGIQGMAKAVLKCNGNMVTKFIEGAESVTVGGNLDTDTILHSKVEVRGNINVSGKNGIIVGGDVRSTVMISAKFIGNSMGTATTVGVGVDPSDKRRLEELKKDIVALNDTKIKLNQIIGALRKKQEADGTLEPEKLSFLQKSTRNLILAERDMTEKRNEFEQLSKMISEDTNARIKVSRTVYPGARIVFGDTVMYVKNKFDYCQFMKAGADIKSIPL